MTIKIFLIILLFITTASLLGIALAIYKKGHLKDKSYFVLLVLSVALYSGAYGVELMGTTLEWMNMLTHFTYIGIATMPTLWILSAAQHTSRHRLLSLPIKTALWSLSAITLILVWTNEYHDLYHINIRLDTSGFLPHTVFDRGVWYYVHMGYLNIALAAGNYLYLASWLTSAARYRRQSAVIFFSSVVPWIGIILYLTGIAGVRINLSPFTLGISCFCIFIGIMKHSLADIAPIARDMVFENMFVAAVILDNADRVVDYNRAAESIFDTEGKDRIGLPFGDMAEHYPALCESINRDDRSIPQTRELAMGNGIYNNILIPIRNRKRRIVGSTLLLRDITDYKVKEERIQALLSEKELLLKEVHHRIKNNMSAVMALLQLHAMSITEPAAVAALEDATNRIHSMMLLYSKLYTSEDFTNVSVKQYLEILIDEIIENFPHDMMIKVVKDIDDFALDSKTLYPLGIIINELITNAMKYAFSPGDSGKECRITASVKKEGSCVSVIIADNGRGLPEQTEAPHAHGFGLDLVSMMSAQLGGSFQHEQKEGNAFIIRFETKG